jgi:transposase
MDPRRLEGILWLADLQADFRLADCKKFPKDNLVLLFLERKTHGGYCSECGTFSERIHSRDSVDLRDLSAFGYTIRLIAERYTLRCSKCNRAVVEKQWLARKGKDFTWRFECHVSRMCEEMTNMAVSRLENIDDKTVFRIDFDLLKLRQQTQVLPADIGPHYSMDEVYFRYYPKWHPQKERSFVTNLADLTHRKIITNYPGRGEKAAESCLLQLTLTQRRQMKSVATDLHDPFHKAIAKHCPHAEVVLDRFHIMQLFNEAMNDFRKEQLGLATTSTEIQLLKGNNKWLLLSGPDKLSIVDKKLLEELKSLNERIVEALLIREQFVQFFESPNIRVAKVRWYKLKALVRAADIKQINEFFRKIQAYYTRLWNFFSHKTSSAIIEALNHKIKTVKAAAYGYRNLHYFQLKILQRVGFLNSKFAPLNTVLTP